MKTGGGILRAFSRRVASAFAIKTEEWTTKDATEVFLALGLFFTTVIAIGRWWQWKEGLLALRHPVGWSLAALAILLIAPNRPVVVVGSLGVCIFYGLITGILRDPIGFAIAVGAFIIAIIIVGLSPDRFTKFHDRRVGWGFRIRKDD